MFTYDQQGTVSVFRPAGALRSDTLDVLVEAVNEYASTGRPSIVIDLSDVTLLDSAALEWLLAIDESCADRGGVFAVSQGTDLVREILELTGLSDKLLVFEEATAAVRSYSQ